MAAAGNPWGTAAQWSVLPARQTVPLPDGATAELGASLGVPAMTAHRALFADGPVDGKSVLVAGGAGAVGHYAIELAKFYGAQVATTVSGPAKAELAVKAGADLVVNYRDANAADQLRAFAPQMDRIVELALGANLDLDLAVSGPQTHIVDYAAEAADPVLPVRRCMNANVTLRFILLYGVPAEAADQAIADISRALQVGALTELPVTRFSLDQVAAAHDAVEAGAVGKVLIEIP
jgi:NADPH2:quinone reductase